MNKEINTKVSIKKYINTKVKNSVNIIIAG